jgi:hypothetical protein
MINPRNNDVYEAQANEIITLAPLLTQSWIVPAGIPFKEDRRK